MRKTTVFIAAAALAVGVSACSSGPNSPGVASLGTSSVSAAPAGSGGGSSGDDKGFTQALKFSQCMRAHGVPGFPDPQQVGSGGGVQLKLGSNSGIDPNSSVFQAAQRACQSLQPAGPGGDGGGHVDPTKVQAWAACMRSHGLPKFPDPTIDGGALKLNLTGTGINPDTMDKAVQACKSLSPGGGLMVQSGGPGR
jgi:hypothetical protein